MHYLMEKVDTAVKRDPICVDPDAVLTDVAEIMWSNDIGIVVVGNPHQPMGVISERDVIAQIAQHHDCRAVTARAAMTPFVVSVQMGEPLSDAATEMLEAGIRHLPVLDHDGRVTGVLSVKDLLRPLVLDALASPTDGRS